MFEYMIGRLIDVYTNGLVVENAGIGYFIYMANPYRFSSQQGQEIKVWLYLSVSENDRRFYGFKDAQEKALFMQLISVSGIGPKSALSILTLDDNPGLIRAIQTNDLSFLSRFPGVGKKTAQRIVLDLKDKVGELAPSPEVQATVSHAENQDQTLMTDLEEALISLGYSNREVKRVVKQADFSGAENTAEAIRLALRYITKS